LKCPALAGHFYFCNVPTSSCCAGFFSGKEGAKKRFAYSLLPSTAAAWGFEKV
jgi:hypothetical protein